MNKISDHPNLNHIFCKAAASVAVATTVSLGLFGEAAQAASFTVNQITPETDLVSHLFSSKKGLSNFKVNWTGDERAFGTFYDDPFGLGEGVVLSTGLVEDLPGQNTIDGSGSGCENDIIDISESCKNEFGQADLDTEFNPDGEGDVDVFDIAALQISFFADSTVKGLAGDFVFGSEEFLEYGGSIFDDDAVVVTLNGIDINKLKNGDKIDNNIAKLSDGQNVTVNNLVPNSNGTQNHQDYIDNPIGTGPAAAETKLDGFTKVLPFEGKLIPNSQNTFTIAIRDLGDARLDSAVFISNVRPVPEPTSLVGLLGLGALGAGSLLKRKQKSANRD